MKILFYLLLVVLFISCGGSSDHDHSDKIIFRYNVSSGLTSIDPHTVWRYKDFEVVKQMFNSLVALNKDMEIIPDLAEKWEVSEDGLVYTFRLKKGVLFHAHESFADPSEREVTAEDVVYSISRVMNDDVNSPGSYIFKDLNKNKGNDFVGVKALDKYTVEFYFNHPNNAFLYQLSLPYGSIVPEEVVTALEGNFSAHPIGTGPFKYGKWVFNSNLVMLKNEEYFESDSDGKSLPYLDAIEISFLKDKNIEFLEFKSGKLDMISGMNEERKDQLLNPDGNLHEKLEDDFYMLKKPWLNMTYVGFYMNAEENSPLSNKYVRQAIAHSINKADYIKYFRNGIGIPASYGIIPMGMPHFNDFKVASRSYDLDKAHALMAAAGYDHNNSAPKVQFYALPEYLNLCEYIQNACKEISLEVEINLLSPGNINQYIAQHEAQFYRKSWVADYPDALNYLQLFYSKHQYPDGGSNYTHFSNAEYDELYLKALYESNTETRNDLYKQMLEILEEEVPVIPIYYSQSIRFAHNYIEGLETNALNIMNMKTLKKNP